MAKTKISELDAAAANNTDINSVDVSEGCAPSGINNAIREMGAMLKRMDNGTDHLTNPNITGDLDVDNININGNTISSTDTNGNITLAPNGTGEVNLADNDKLTFGAGSDMQVFHDGSNSFIKDAGPGSLQLHVSGLDVLNAAAGEFIIRAAENGSVDLYHDNSKKLETTASGIDVSGTALAHTVEIGDGSAGGTSEIVFSDNVSGRAKILYDHGASPNEEMGFEIAGTRYMTIENGGNIGINTSAPSKELHVKGDIDIEGDTGGVAVLRFKAEETHGTVEGINIGSNFGGLAFKTNNNGTTSEVARLDSSGRLLVGTTTEGISDYGDTLTIADSDHCGMTIRSGTSSEGNVYFSDGTSGDAEYKGIVKYEHSSNDMSFWSNSLRRMTIDSSGNVGIGVSSMTNKLVLPNAAYFAMQDTGGAESLAIRANSSNAMEFLTGGGEKMRITSGGEVLIAKTASDNTTEGFRFRTTGEATFVKNSSSGAPIYVNRQGNDGTAINFGRANSQVGTITVNASATAYNTSSDHRLKENVADMTGAIDRVKALAPKRFNFITNPDTTVDGFLAHEAQAVVPEAVTGTHNEVDEDGNAVMQGIDQSKLVPLLTAALKESIAKIEDLETRLAALEGA